MGLKLGLDTAGGNHVDNEQGQGPLSAFESAQFADMERRYGSLPDLRVRGEATVRYNCHGMTFAGRRTAISDDEAIELILSEDGYQEVDLSAVLPGDILVYFEDGRPIHSAIVIEVPRGLQLLPVPLVISKWGNYRELIHRAHSCPYVFANAKYFRVIVP